MPTKAERVKARRLVMRFPWRTRWRVVTLRFGQPHTWHERWADLVYLVWG